MILQKTLLFFIALCALSFIAVDQLYISKLEKEFKELEKQRILTSNKLATAKIIHENLNHVKELVFENMVFPDQKDTITHETKFFEFFTRCVNDLKLKLITVKPERPVTKNRVTTFAYAIKLEGDFFKFGELCAKLENSRRIASIETFTVTLMNNKVSTRSRRHGGSNRILVTKGVRVSMRINTYQVKKNSRPINRRVRG